MNEDLRLANRETRIAEVTGFLPQSRLMRWSAADICTEQRMSSN